MILEWHDVAYFGDREFLMLLNVESHLKWPEVLAVILLTCIFFR